MEKTGICTITGNAYPINELVGIDSIRPQLAELIRKTYPDWKAEKGMVSIHILNKFRNEYVKKLLEEEVGELNNLELDVMQSIRDRSLITEKPDGDTADKLTFGQRIADKMALFGGSWRFIIIFGIMLFLWISLNTFLILSKPYDPYPFILLNLILSCLAAIQAPVIMMSQNRQEMKDRDRSMNDYQVNLKAEIEIRQLHEKIDHMMVHQSNRMLEIQQIQLELLEQLLKKHP
jgi:uncharacterized membrane protein